MAFSPATALARSRAGQALRRPHNWVQLAKFSVVGASGYAINLAVYTALLRGAGFHYTLAATCSFVVAVTNNYTWNRLWTFHAQRGHVGWQGLRFLIVALVAYAANLGLLAGVIALGAGKVGAPGGAVLEAWTGPQVAWKMARGYPGAFGGKEINSAALWLGFCALFFLGLADLRRPLSLRNLDLLALLSFSISLWYFNR